MEKKDWEDETPEANAPTGIDPEDVIVGGRDDDPVSEAYARTGRADTNGTSGIPAYDEDAGKQRRELYDEGADLVSRID
jgi:hypothetical protein